MVVLFTPKHQKLVNQCYPTGRAPDKKPKSSETSYLLYYVNSRRTKLEKVSGYLVRRSGTDLSHRRVGNVMVTLELLSRIVVSCKENMNVFVKDFLDIMIKTMSNNNFNNDVNVVEGVEEVFGNICEHLDGVLYSGDSEFIQMYQSFVDVYLQVVVDRLRSDELLMKGCLDISKTTNLANNVQVSGIIVRGVELTLTKFQELHPKFQGEDLEEVPLSHHHHEKRLSRSQTYMTGEVKSNCSDYSERALQSFFNTTETDKLSIAIKALIRRLIQVPNKELLQYIANSIPVQLRYIVVLLMAHELTQESEPINCVTILKLMSGLLVSEVSIIGLSVLDFMRKIVSFQLGRSNDVNIAEACTVTIASLNKKTYYKDQPLDMISELLLRLKDENLSHLYKDILVSDLRSILSTIHSSFMPLDLYLELAPYFVDDDDYVSIFDLVSEKVPNGFIMNTFFTFLSSLADVDKIEGLMDMAFQKFKYFTLLCGLLYYLPETNSAEDKSYYAYHSRAAEFLKSEQYKDLTSLKRNSKELFTRTELVNYYSDPATNKYSEKALRILISQSNGVSTTDLISETPPSDHDLMMDAVIPGTFQISESHSVPTTPQQQNSKITTTSASNCDNSLKSMEKPKTPKVSDLKKAAKGLKPAPSHASLRASHSAKSKVTNITFLLDELNQSQENNFNNDSLNISNEGTLDAKEKPALAAPVKLEPIDNQHTSHQYCFSRDIAKTDTEVPLTLRGKIFSS